VQIAHRIVCTSHSFVRNIHRMSAIELKINDLAKVTGYSRFQLDGFLKKAFAGSSVGRRSGTQRKFSPQDLLVVAVACEIERKYQFERKALAQITEALRQALLVPRGANRAARLLITIEPPVVLYLEPNVPVTEGLVMNLGPLFAKVDEYLGASGPSPESAQVMLPLEPAIATSRRRSSRSR
jgi:hypothetical protein